jgi:hypothetical protein
MMQRIVERVFEQPGDGGRLQLVVPGHHGFWSTSVRVFVACSIHIWDEGLVLEGWAYVVVGLASWEFQRL